LIDPHVAVVADDDVVDIKDRELSGHHATIAEQAASPLAERYQTVAPVPCPAFSGVSGAWLRSRYPDTRRERHRVSSSEVKAPRAGVAT